MSSNDVQPTQTTNTNNINNQDATKESSATTSAETSSLPKVENAHDQSTTSDVNTIEDPASTRPATSESTKPSDQVQTTDVNKHVPEISTTTSSPSQVQPTTAIETDTPTHDPETSSPTETSTTQIPDSDSNKQSTPPVSTGNSLPTEPPSTSQTQIPDSNINNTQDHHPTDPPTSEIPNSDVNKQPTTVSTQDHGPTETTTSEPSTSQVPANKQDTIDSPEISNSNQEHDSVDHIKSDKDTSSKIDSDDNPTTPDQDRKHLLTLIHAELQFVEKIYRRLGTHQDLIKEERDKAFKLYNKLQDEECGLRELKDLKRIVTKLKLQIPAKYRTYDDNDKRRNQKLFPEDSGLISAKLLKRLPRLHHELFQQSPFCKTIQQRYNDLSLELKLCLLCFSVFPENEEISRRLMVYWWIAEGLIPAGDDPAQTEDRANEFFAELMDKDFIEPVSRSPERYVASCKMQPMIRAALVMISDKIKFIDFDEFGNPKDFGKFDEIESPEEMPVIDPLGDPREFFYFFNKNGEPTEEGIEFDPKGKPILFAPYEQNKDKNRPVVDRNGNLIDTTNYYLYKKKEITMKSYKACLMGTGLPKGLRWEKLHMLFNVKDDILEFKLEWFLRMENVNLLLLGRWQSSAVHHIEVEEFNFKDSLEHMKHVRFFSLQGVSRISELPESISKLEGLLILDLRACHNLEKIPKTIGSLKHLTHLDMSECYLLKDLPKEISSLQSLQVLKGFVVVDSPETQVCTLQDLNKLEHLRKLSMYTHMKAFPRASHLDALQKLEALRKLTILWGGHESKKKENADNEKPKDRSSKILPKMFHHKRVQGSMRRMNAFNNSTLGSRLEKLDLKCFPDNITPDWLKPGSLKGLKKLYIRGGQFSDLGQYQDIDQCDDSLNIPVETWNVKVLRLKYLDELKMEWRDLQTLFPEMTSLEKVKCPRLTMFPCNERGVWIRKPSTSG